MKTEVLTPEHERVMAEHPGLNQRQWWLVSDLTERLAQSESRRKELAEALREYFEDEKHKIHEHGLHYYLTDWSDDEIREFTCQCHAPDNHICTYCKAEAALSKEPK